MTDIVGSIQFIQAEEAGYRAPVSANLATRLGSSINKLLDALTPVGSIDPTYLTEAEYQAEVKNTNWVLADGRSCIGTVLGTKRGWTNLPDMRGVTIRGKNGTRADGYANPDGDLDLGALQADEFKSHTHVLHGNVTGSNGTLDTDTGTDKYNADPYIASVTMDAAGGNETRMKNATVNFMIRVN
jgi:hypothetical protein